MSSMWKSLVKMVNCNGEELMIKLIYVCMVGINWRLCICEVMRIP